MQTADTVQQETLIDADPATIFAFLTDPDRLTRWMGVTAILEPKEGGLYLVDVTNGNVACGEFREVVPVSRLSYSFGWQNNDELPPGGSLVEIDLIPQAAGTLVRMTHSGLPASRVADHAKGWAHYYARLAIAAGGGDPGPDPWVKTKGKESVKKAAPKKTSAKTAARQR
jgi:uncharacterized protein YndB with AHSA1/START domain